MLVLVIGGRFPYPYPEKTVADAKNPMWGNFSGKKHRRITGAEIEILHLITGAYQVAKFSLQSVAEQWTHSP